MNARLDMIGKKFGKLTVVENAGIKNRYIHWLCKCECGNSATISGSKLRSGATKSCGCISVGEQRKKEPLYKKWMGMRIRCGGYNPHTSKYYKDRGITICDEWQDYRKFSDWALAHGYEEGLTIDRIDNDQGYSPDNCRWITMFDQMSNQRTNKWITIGSETLTQSQWARKIGVCYASMHAGLKRFGVAYIADKLKEVIIVESIRC